jgi:hypothetical protein
MVQGNSQTTLTIDSAYDWIGYMAWSPVSGDAAGYGGSGSSVWGTGALIAFFDPTGTNTLTIQPNTNTYAPGVDYWVNANGSGANNMDASFYVQNDSLEGQTLTFNGTCLTNNLVSPYTSVAFIKEFDASYNIINEDEVTPVAGQPFSLFLVTGTGVHIQYGFETVGPDANPNTLASLGEVVYAQQSADPQVSTPNNQGVVQGQNATFSVTASGTSPFHYQWSEINANVTNVLSNGSKYSGVTSNSLTITNVTSSDAATYLVTVTNSVGSASASAYLVVVPLVQAETNLLVDPSFESGVFDPSGNAGWSDFSGADFENTNDDYYDSSTPVTVVDGTNCLQIYAAGQYNGVYQDKPALPGQIYTASAWFLTPSSDQISGANTCFLEVQFRDAGGNLLEDYESSPVTTNFPANTWTNLSPTNLIVSPAGTVSVRFQITYYFAGVTGGSVYVDDVDLRLRAPAYTISASGSNAQITFPTVPGPTFRVLYKTNLTDPTWLLLTSVTGDGTVKTVFDPFGTRRFYIVNTQ